MKSYATIITAALLTFPLTSAGALETSVASALANGSGVDGQHVYVKGCTIVGASRYFSNCAGEDAAAAHILLDNETLDQSDLQAALTACRSMTPSAQCEADISGIATVIGSQIVVKHAGIYWKAQEAADLDIDARTLAASQQVRDDSHILVRNCTIAGANGKFLSCTVPGQDASPNLLLDTSTLHDADLQRALMHCTSWNPNGACVADVAGKVTKIGSYYKLDHAGVFWANTETTAVQ